MCFSAGADLIAGVVVTGAGVESLRHVRHRREIAIAILPLLFGAHQVVEAFVWWGLDGTVSGNVGDVATRIYLAVAFVLPVLVPVAILLLEDEPGRRRRVAPFIALGGGVFVWLLVSLWAGPVGVEDAGAYIAYDVGLTYGGPLVAAYVVATCAPLLLSSRRRLVVYGVLNLAAVTTLAWLLAEGVISLWCAWAAVTSVMIVLHLRTFDRRKAVA